MWRPPRLDNKLVTITFQPQALTCSIITTSSKRAPFAVRAYQRFPLRNLELERLILFNPTKIKQNIQHFLHVHDAQNAYVSCMLNGPELFEKISSLRTATPTVDDFNLPQTNASTWQHRYLYPSDNGKWIFYIAGIPHKILLQYQLLAIAAELNLLTVTTTRMALLKLYQYQQGTAFRRAQLAIDMLQHHNMPEYLFSPDSLKRLLYTPSSLGIDNAKEAPHLLSACGLFVAERILI